MRTKVETNDLGFALRCIARENELHRFSKLFAVRGVTFHPYRRVKISQSKADFRGAMSGECRMTCRG